MRYLKGSELERETLKWMELAIRESVNSPCGTDKRGVVIINEGQLVGKGANGPPIGFECEPSYCGKSCRVPAVHAEINAILDAGKKRYSVEGGTMYHARTEKGILQNSREPRCADCSKHVLQAGIFDIVLKHVEGYALYGAEEFHEISLKNYRERILR